MKIVVREASLEDAPLIADLTRKAWAANARRPRTVTAIPGSMSTKTCMPEALSSCWWTASRPGSLRWAPLVKTNPSGKSAGSASFPLSAAQNLSQNLLEAVIHHAQLCEISELRLFLHRYLEPLTSLYEAYGFELAPEIEFSTRNTMDPPPVMMRKILDP